MFYQAQGYQNQAFFPRVGTAYRIPLYVQNAAGQMQQIDVIADPGDDITILTTDTAYSLGYDPASEPGGWLPVSGITAGAQAFKKIVANVQIPGLAPIQIHLGLALQQESLAENLFGKEGVSDRYDITFSNEGVTFTERGGGFGAAAPGLANLGGRANYAVTTLRRFIL